MAPAKANPPPTTQTTRIDRASGRICATRIGTKKMPPPITLDTTMATASSGPRRRSSEGKGVRITGAALRSWGQELTRDGRVADFRPLGRAVFSEKIDFCVDEL